MATFQSTALSRATTPTTDSMVKPTRKMTTQSKRKRDALAQVLVKDRTPTVYIIYHTFIDTWFWLYS